MVMEDNESCSSRVVESTAANSRHQRLKLEVFNEVLWRLKDSDNIEAKQDDFDDELWAHFNRLPTRYALDVNVERAEDVLTHKRLLQEAHDPAKRPVFDVRLVQVSPSSNGHNDDSINSSSPRTEVVQSIHPPPAFGSSPNLEALAIEANKSHVQDGDSATNACAKYSRPMHEITFSADDKPKLLSQLTSLLAEIGLNIQEAHAFSTVDGYSLDVFVVDGWPYEETEQLRTALAKEIRKIESQSWPNHIPSPLKGNEQNPMKCETHHLTIPNDGTDVWEIDPQQLKFECKVASGSYGDLYKGTYCSQEVAIKVLKAERVNAEMQREFAQEVYIMRKVRHKNVVQFIGACTKPPSLCIVTEYMSGGSVYDYLHKQKGTFKLPSLLKVAIDISKGMNYLHQNNIIHRDLKAANLLMDENEVVKVADFGVARVKAQSGVMTAETGTYRWMAPEVIEHKPYDHKADIFSFAIVLWELLTGKIPYEFLTPLQAAVGVVQKGLRPTIPKNTLPKLTELLERCWQQDPTLRPDFTEIIAILQQISKEGDSMASTNSTQWDVFLSFHGVDTRYKFTNYLYNDLNLHGLRPFRDDPELRTGEVISDALKEAIRNSKTCVVVFSENYASSPWCLDELVEIYKCFEEKERLVIGVYYHVHPSIVRHQTESFEIAFKKHETGRFSDKIDQVNQWRRALKGVAQFSGHTISPQSDGVDIINKIASVILQHVKPKTLHVADHYVARRNLQLIKNTIAVSLSSEKVKDAIKIGLHGLGGVGKTTLAKAIYNHLLDISDFNASCCFLADVREAFGRSEGLVSLQNQLINAFVKSETKDEVHNKDQGTEFIKQRFGLTKVVLVLDDIDNTEQCNSLMGPFAPGSVVIITTRDTAILDKIQVKSSHQFEVTVMKDAESLKLFTAHAFPNAKPDNNLMKLFQDDILGLAGNLPLALTVYGSHLSTESKEGWEDYIKKLKLNPNSTILDRLMISLDAMKDLVLKNIFIDIACFFNGRNINEAVKIMETCYHVNVDHNIRTLSRRSLLTINFKGELRMHDLLRDIGWKVARNKCPGEPRKYSRLWITEDIYDLLAEGKGKETIEGIIPSNFNYENALKGVEFSTKTFKKMSKLRLIYLKDVNLTGSFKQRFGSLTWLCWDCCPLMELGSDFWPKKVVILELRNSNIKKWELTKVFEKLKTLDMSDSLNITTLPDFRNLPILEILNLKGCTSLEKFDILSGCLTKLVSLNLGGCVNLGSICDSHCSLKALEVLVVTKCRKLKSLPDNLWDIASFQKLSISSTEFKSPFEWLCMIGSSLTTLPSSLSQLLNLVEICIVSHNLVFIEQLPPNLKILKLYQSKSLIRLPDLSNFKHLVDLGVKYSPNVVSIEHLPPNLEQLYLRGCTGLKRLPNLSNFKCLKELSTTHCNGLKEIIGLEEIITSLDVLCCNSSHVAYSSLRRIFQQNHLEKEIAIYVDKLPDWIHSCDGDNADIFAPNLPHNFLALLLCLGVEDLQSVKRNRGPYQTVTNVTTGDTYKLGNLDDYESLVMILIPRSIIPVSGGDKIVTSGDRVLRGFRLLYDD